MLELACYYEARESEMELNLWHRLWELTRRTFKVDSIHILGHNDLATLTDTDKTIVVVTESGKFTPTVSLPDFEHPKDCVYLVGRNSAGFYTDGPLLKERPNTFFVSIPTPANQSMFSAIAAGIVLYDRTQRLEPPP